MRWGFAGSGHPLFLVVVQAVVGSNPIAHPFESVRFAGEISRASLEEFRGFGPRGDLRRINFARASPRNSKPGPGQAATWSISGRAVMNYARRQQYRRLSRAGGSAAGGAAAPLLALALATAGAILLATVLLLAAVGFALATRHWLGLAGRSRVGARSEDDVRRQLAALETNGWRTRRWLPWRGPGDIDSVAIAPGGIAFADRDEDQDL
jgi:hypothetical protein